VRKGAAARDHEVVVLHGEPLGGARVQRQEAAEAILADAEALQVRRVDRPPGETSVRAGFVVEERVDRRVRVAVGDRGERALAAAHHEQVVVDESRRQARGRLAVVPGAVGL
jgi:hypothetical protein